MSICQFCRLEAKEPDSKGNHLSSVGCVEAVREARRKTITDTQRLDWLEKNHWDLVHTEALGGLWAIGNSDNDDELADGKTPREAIDRAMKGER